MRPVATVVAWSVWLSLSVGNNRDLHKTAAEPMEMPFDLWIPVAPRNPVTCGGSDAPLERAMLGVH